MLKILRTIESWFASLERFILNRRNRDIAPLSVRDLKRMTVLNETLERNASAIQQYYSELNRILRTAYDLNDNEMSA